MSRLIAPTSNDLNLSDLMRDVDDGTIQLPEFQRGWTWDDFRIRGIIASITEGYPIGALTKLRHGGDSVRFSYRAIEGVEVSGKVPTFLILDGQQRLTSIYEAAYSSKPVVTKNDKGKDIRRYYYLDINKCLDENVERIDAVIPVPDSRIIKTNFDRDIVMDLSTRENEYMNEMFPLNLIFNSRERERWAEGYYKYHGYNPSFIEKYINFRSEVIETATAYRLPVITLEASTPREAVCKVFENINTGGVILTVFELVTASFAAEGFNLRKDWEQCRDIIRGTNPDVDIMNDVDEVSFLTAMTLYATYMKSDAPTSCKRKDILSLSYADYEACKPQLLKGYELARKFLQYQCVFHQRDLPYSAQLIPLSAICAVIGETAFNSSLDKLAKWYWCGVFGEMYGSAVETRYAHDIEDVTADIRGEPSLNRTVNSSFFQASRLLLLQTRNSAAYKGIMALLCKKGCMDFVNGTALNIAKSINETPDIHHIFPAKYCTSLNLPREKWNSIVNKTPLLLSSNRFIGSKAPSVYSASITGQGVTDSDLRKRIESNLIDYDAFIADDFDAYFVGRAKKLLRLIEEATGITITDKGSVQTIELYGASLA